MSYTLIKGAFRVVGFQPDGDSVRFVPHDADLVNALPNRNITLAPGKSIQLRLECIDALETHYTSGSGRFTNQPMAAAMAAREQLLTLLGFTGVEWDEEQKNVIGVDEDDRPGYILSNTFDSYGARPVSYAFAGDPSGGEDDGADVFLRAERLLESANHQLVAQGYAYPMYYEGAFFDLRAAFDAGVAQARAAAGPDRPNNIWTSDVTMNGFTDPPDALTLDLALWPKLFRRLSSFYKDDPGAQLSEFPAWLEANRDACLDLDTGSWTALHNYVEWNGGRIRMTKSFLRLLFEG
jgi:endonuclease YncB( thermonuclease family)